MNYLGVASQRFQGFLSAPVSCNSSLDFRSADVQWFSNSTLGGAVLKNASVRHEVAAHLANVVQGNLH